MTKERFPRIRKIQGTQLMNHRINFHDGRRPSTEPDISRAMYEGGISPYWSVVRHVPKVPIWATSGSPRATLIHLARYQLVATSITGIEKKITVWACGNRCYTEPKILDAHPRWTPADAGLKACAKCEDVDLKEWLHAQD